MQHWYSILLCTFYLLLCPSSTKSQSDAITFVLLGAKGDLAKRFIWPAMLELMDKDNEILTRFRLIVFAASREPASPSSLQDLFATFVEEDNFNLKILANATLLLSTVKYVQLKSIEDYAKLNNLIVSQLENEGLNEVSRIYYLSVPPSAYGWIVRVIDSVGRPTSGRLQVALEKPFGEDLTSALALTSVLQQHLSDDEIFLVDHYLGKQGVQQILHFRQINGKTLDPLWNSDNIQMVKIVASETVTAQGRTAYYDQYGVIRDMLQNHLTEVLSLLLCDQDDKSLHSCTEKEILSKVYPPPLESALVGQYLGYTAHLQEDNVGSEISNITSSTPTFASVVLYIRDPRWMGVPFLITSGKHMKKKSTYVQILFKDNMHCPAGSTFECTTSPTEVVFIIDSHIPGVCFSAAFDRFIPPYTDWESTSCSNLPSYENGKSQRCTAKCFVPILKSYRNTYTTIISSMMIGSNDFFLSIENLIQSWEIWTPLLNELEASRYQKMFVYTPESLERLQITVNAMKLAVVLPELYSFMPHSNFKFASIVNSDSYNHSVIPEVKKHFSALIGVRVISDFRSNLASNLARMIFTSALKAVKERGVFNLALPGGMSPLIIYQYLILNFRHLFPWHGTHIWQTDERCVGRNSSNSNLHQFSKYLLEYVPIPHHNIHPLPGERACNAFQESSTFHLGLVVPENGFDFVLLGVGLDGHVASLFPESEVEFSMKLSPVEYVLLSQTSPVAIKSRLSLDIEHLTNTQELGIMLIDRQKCDIIKTISSMSEDSYNTSGSNYPFIRLLLHIKQRQLENPRLSQSHTVVFVEESCFIV